MKQLQLDCISNFTKEATEISNKISELVSKFLSLNGVFEDKEYRSSIRGNGKFVLKISCGMTEQTVFLDKEDQKYITDALSNITKRYEQKFESLDADDLLDRVSKM